jgi:DNA-binding MarR family transcriptional regulator
MCLAVEQALDYWKAHPGFSATQIAKQYGIAPSSLTRAIKRFKAKRKKT